jgi:FAD:protein FMN transferase
MLKKLFILFFSLIFLLSCGKEVKKIESEKFLSGTYIRITVYDSDEKLARQSIEKAFNEIARIDSKFNSKVPESVIGKLNSSEDKSVKLDEEGKYLFNEVNKMYELSNRKYDITIEPLLKVWGFGEVGKLSVPTFEEIKKAQETIDFSKVKIEGDNLIIESPVKSIDTGSFLKGYAVQKAKEKLKETGIKSAFITSISSIDVIGTKPEKKSWRIGVQNPQSPDQILGVVELNDESMGVSGDYQTYVEIDGERYHHILDKTTGCPIVDKKMVLVICDNAFIADMYSTAFFTMPIEKIISYAEKDQKMKVLVVDKDMRIFKSKNLEFFEK